MGLVVDDARALKPDIFSLLSPALIAGSVEVEQWGGLQAATGLSPAGHRAPEFRDPELTIAA